MMIRTRESFAQVGQAMFGPTWQGPLQSALGINERTLRRFLAEDGPEIPEGVWRDMGKLCRDRAQQLILLADQIGAGGFQTQVNAAARPSPPRR
jgi:hypothetical protein